ncbi:MAG: hypothetical protein WA364_07965 [Candidatus Nitrosopolaris sp.]
MRFAKMDLVNQDRPYNLLHKDGTVDYYPNVPTDNEGSRYFDLVNISSQSEKLRGMVILTTCIPSNITKQALAWIKDLLELKQIVEKSTETKFNSFIELIS